MSRDKNTPPDSDQPVSHQPVSHRSVANNFEALGIPRDYLTFLRHQGILRPTEIQSQAIPLVMEGKNLIAIAQTGSGKTLAFVLPILLSLTARPQARAIVFVQSREMAQQIFKVFMDFHIISQIEPYLVIGGIPNDKQVIALRKNPRIIIATPGRMNDHLLTNKLLLKGVELLVLDEADRMVDMGFSSQLVSIHKTLRGHRQTLMFSASFNEEVEKMTSHFFLSPPEYLQTLKANAPVSQLKQKIYYLGVDDKYERLELELKKLKKSVLVFTADQERCDEIGEFLKDSGFGSDHVHGGMTQSHRNRVVREFREGTTRILVTTDLLARGLDVPEIGTVINMDLPYEGEDFLHRIGRTARAGRAGLAITFVTPLDYTRYKQIESYIAGAEEIKLNSHFTFRTS